MFESIINFFKKMGKQEKQPTNSKDAAKERLQLVLMQDRANVSADFLDLMKQEIIEVIKKYIDVDENAIDVRLMNKENSDGTKGAPALYANIPIVSIKEEMKEEVTSAKKEEKQELKQEDEKQEELNEKASEVKTEEENLNKEQSQEKEESKEELVEEKEEEKTEAKKEEIKVEEEIKEETVDGK